MPNLDMICDSKTGFGHVSRCVALHQAWTDLGFGEANLIPEPFQGDILYSDGPPGWYKNLANEPYDLTVVAHSGVEKVYADLGVCFEYQPGVPFNIITDYAPNTLVGFEYFPLRREIAGLQWSYQSSHNYEYDQVCIIPGSAGTMNVERIKQQVEESNPFVQAVVLENMLYEDFISEALKCSFAICSASTAAVELASCGMPVAVMITVDNQVTLFNSLTFFDYCTPFKLPLHLYSLPRMEPPQNGALRLAEAIYEEWKERNEQ